MPTTVQKTIGDAYFEIKFQKLYHLSLHYFCSTVSKYVLVFELPIDLQKCGAQHEVNTIKSLIWIRVHMIHHCAKEQLAKLSILQIRKPL